MPDWSLVRSPHVLLALGECDRMGAKDFLGRYGVRRARVHTLWHHGNEYDPQAVMGAAHRHATGRAATWDEDSGGERGAAKALTGLGFDVVAQEQPVVAPRARKAAPTAPTAKAPTARARARKTVPQQPAVRLCPRCHVAVPATGVCDFCD